MRVARAWGVLLAAVALIHGCAVDEPLHPAPPVGGEGGESSGRGGSGAGGRAHASGGSGASDQAGAEGIAGADAGTGAGGGDGACGDGQRDSGEACDDGNLDGGDGCNASCKAEPTEPACGDGRKQAQEYCDDGNLEGGDGCDPECREERCGNRRLDSGEECDPPAAGKCTTNCSFVRRKCGNGHVDRDAEEESRNEQCDDGNDEPGDGCFECRFECGDKRIDRSIGEACDRGLSPQLCSDTCQWLPICGDGEVDPATSEQCDPSNGVTCVACRTVVPPSGCSGGAGNALGAGDADCPGSGTECTPLGVANLVQNGTFDSDVSGWAPHSTQVTLSAADDGDPAPKALDVALAIGQVRAQSGAYVCIPVQADRKYELSARYRIPADAVAGVGATVTTVIYAGTRCQGAFVGTPGSGPFGGVRDAWTPYQLSIDTSPLSGAGRLLLRLDAVRPGAVAGTHVRWDSVSLTTTDGICGNCEIDAGEACDDGNQTSGDGCSAVCGLERCGDGTKSSAEQCDDGNAVFGQPGDHCTPSCRTPDACDTCAVSGCATQVDACLGLDGAAQAGPRVGTPRSTLCDELRTCVQATSCQLVSRENAGVKGAFLENCYCGTAGDDCFETPGAANGSCRTQVEAAVESEKPTTLAGRLSGADRRYPVFAAAKALLACEQSGCGSNCVREPACGDGYRQDRKLDLQFFVEGQYVACHDDFTTSGRGCSFEECDDGNLTPGDGCDAHCLLEACGNYLVQAGENCDDGNVEAGDGCDAHCQSEYDCGDGVVESIEQCDPPGGDHGCTQAEHASNPAQCACDERCKRVVCGDGKVQRPLEQCDPPNGVTCGDDCKLADQGPCERCIGENPDLADMNETYCSDSDCIAIKQCILESGCYYPLGPFACYCGSEIGECYDNPKFVPVGPCRELIGAAVGPPGLDNATALERSTNPNNPAGFAFLVVSEAQYVCFDDCFPNASE